MTKTVKELATELGVSKPTISKAMSELGINAEKIGNRYVLNETQISEIKSKILQKTENKNENATENSENNSESSQNSKIGTEKTENSEMLCFLQSQIEFLNAQLQEKDKQLSEKDNQISSLMQSLQASQTLQHQTLQIAEQAESKKQGFFSRLFKRNKE